MNSPLGPTVPSRHGSWVLGLLPCSVLAFCLAMGLGRDQPSDASVLICFLWPLFSWFGPWRSNFGIVNQPSQDDAAWRQWAVLILILLTLLAISTLIHAAPNSAWGRWIGLSASAALFLGLARGTPAPDAIPVLGASAAASILTATACHLWLGPTHFGFGNISYMTNTTSPSLILWLVWECLQPRSGNRKGRLVVLGLGLLCLAILTWDSRRRGVMVAWTASAGMAILLYLHHRGWSRVVWPLGILAILAVLFWVGWLTAFYVPASPWIRIGMLRAAIAVGWEGGWLGHGLQGVLNAQWSSAQPARELTAGGDWFNHAHNELLDLWVNGGWVALVIGLLAIIAWIRHATALIDDAWRRAILVALPAIVVHAATDIVYGTIIGGCWLGLVAGLIIGAPSRRPIPAIGPRWIRGLPAPWIGLACLPACLWGIFQIASLVFLPISATPDQRWRSLTLSCEVDAITANVGRLVDYTQERRDPLLLLTVLDATSKRIGESGRIPGWRVMAWGQLLRKAEKGGDQLAIDEARCHLAIAQVALARRNPFNYLCLRTLSTMALDHKADLAGSIVPHSLARRSRWAIGRDLPDDPPLLRANDIESHADLWAWGFGQTFTSIGQASLTALDPVFRRYGHLPDVGLLYVIASCQADSWPDGWLENRFCIPWGLERNAFYLEFLDALQPGHSGHRFRELAGVLYPDLLRRVRSGLPAIDPSLLPLWSLRETVQLRVIAALGRLHHWD